MRTSNSAVFAPQLQTPAGMLPREKNCVAMTFSACYQQPVNAIVNHFLQKNIIKNPSELQWEKKILEIMKELKSPQVCENITWRDARNILLSDKSPQKGRYFVINTKNHQFNGSDGGAGHAFCCIKNGYSLGINGNNAESRETAYNKVISLDDHVTMWGPFTPATEDKNF